MSLCRMEREMLEREKEEAEKKRIRERRERERIEREREEKRMLEQMRCVVSIHIRQVTKIWQVSNNFHAVMKVWRTEKSPEENLQWS